MTTTEWPLGHGRHLRHGQTTQVWIADVGSRAARMVFETDRLLLEAPNWAPEGAALLLNGAGRLWRLELGHREPSLRAVAIADLPPINNDHVVSADGTSIFLSANDGHIYRAPLGGGQAARVTQNESRYHFLHGVSPDGSTLAFVELPAGDFTVAGRLALMPSAGGAAWYPEAGSGHLDGPEFSPEGGWIYLNTEHFATEPGHAQLARVPADGGMPERLVASDTVDWFPHLAPDGRHACYLSFPAGTRGHPADLDVEVRLVDTADWSAPLTSFRVPGGQGTINVNSWAPDSHRFAFVSYPRQPSADQPSADQPSPDQPSPDQPSPDQPSPDQPSPDQPSPKEGPR